MSIEFHSLNGTVDGDGDAKVIGLVENTSDEGLDLQIDVTFYKGDEYLGHSSDYIDVPPGGKRPFEVSAWDTWMTRFELQCYER